VNEHAFKLFIAKDFAKALQNKFIVYAFIICNIVEELIVEHQVKALNNTTSCITNTFETQILLIELTEYEGVFLTESINRLSLHEKHNHAIEITAESSYDLLYNLSNTELATLKQYLDNVLTKK